MSRTSGPEWHPLLFGLVGLLVVAAVALGPRAQAADRLFQTVPTPTPQTVPLPTAPTTPHPPQSNDSTGPASGAALLTHLEVSRPDVLPGEDLQFTLYLTNTTATALAEVSLQAPLDSALLPLELWSTQGSATVEGGHIVVYLYTLEAGQTAQVALHARVAAGAPVGHIFLLQFTSHWDGQEGQSNVAAAALPPAELPPTGDDRR